MAVERKALDPQVIIKDSQGNQKIVSAGPLDWKGVKEFLDTLSASNLPLPDLASGSISSWLESSQQGIAAIDPTDPPDVLATKAALAQQHSNLGLYRVVADLLSENMQVIYQWVLKHPPIVGALVKGATGLTPEEIDGLSAGALLRVAKASWKALVDDGFFTEVGSFFGELLPQSRNQAGATAVVSEQVSQTLPASGEASAATSKSESAVPPAGP